jgi:aspartate aminotransferase
MFEQGAELKEQYGADQVYDFTLGNPVLEPPEAFKTALQEAAGDAAPGLHRYMPNAGISEAREAIAHAVGEEHDVPLEAKHVVMTTGAASALNVVLKALLDPGDEVIVLAPYFVEYLFYVTNHGGEVRVVETGPDFQIDLDRLSVALGPKTKAIIINSPNNPTGALYSSERLQAVAQILRQHEQEHGGPVHVILDEPYRRLVFDGQPVPPSLRIFPNGIFCTSHAKDLSIPGERIGYLCVNPQCADARSLLDACAFTIRILGFVNAPALMQRTVASLQRTSIDVDHYQRRRDVLYEGLVRAGYRCVRPAGAFYLFPESPIPDDVAFVKKLMKHRILAVPGSGFGRPGYFRLAYCVAQQTITNALAGFAEALAEA